MSNYIVLQFDTGVHHHRDGELNYCPFGLEIEGKTNVSPWYSCNFIFQLEMPYFAIINRILTPALTDPEIVPLILLVPIRFRYGTGTSIVRIFAQVALICISIVQP